MAELIVTTPGRTRLRRLRRTRTLRNLVAETSVGAQHLIMPHFVLPAKRANEPISSMPGIAQHGLRRLAGIQFGNPRLRGKREPLDAFLLGAHPLDIRTRTAARDFRDIDAHAADEIGRQLARGFVAATLP